jgi:hypothetical protein
VELIFKLLFTDALLFTSSYIVVILMSPIDDGNFYWWFRLPIWLMIVSAALLPIIFLYALWTVL